MGGHVDLSVGVIIGISIGVGIGVLLAACLVACARAHKKRISRETSDSRGMVLPIRVNGVDSSVMLSDSINGPNAPAHPKESSKRPLWLGGGENHFHSVSSGITKFSYKELQKATSNFTAILGQGAFGPVYKAIQPSGVVLAVKALAVNSKQGEKEFETEVMLLGRLHHRNLVNLRGYCAERGHRMLVYDFMRNGSLADLLYAQQKEPLEWELRVRIAQDISRGIEYLHDGAIPPVIHRDIKSANILLDESMTARVADFGLSKEVSVGYLVSGVKGTYGYVDPEYIATNTYTEKSDVYSFGILLFELITGRNAQQGLMDYVHLASMDAEGKDGWDALLDPRLDGKCNQEELGAMASIANRCVRKIPAKRPRIRDVAQSLSRINRRRPASKTNKQDLAPISDVDEVDDSDYSKG
ncbi:hypothetical protein O6H91_11G096400 [Diphasiastrum complanatum]|uniref:Uncharacterized protein n=3 Tax=Diphasiastrum complanatum TaxID=34168 RepID=A0ACC2CC37_DIPCM|nr:hypothetical protein O6H91_11G093800 [Diphasiastrum complanatum]KAJ7539496.1 hypothetical protein O6H91_11G096400 [Diphasiastrum complanatum]KAJ7539497.1 hypothetical protein O6H91_11G096400 [Diphasiastrum complanatum]